MVSKNDQISWLPAYLQDFLIETRIDPTEAAKKKWDTVFVGNGLASTATCIEMLKQADQTSGPSEKRGLLFVEKEQTLWGGVAYGYRSGYTALLITPLKDFLPAEEQEPFQKWVAENADWLLEPIRQANGERSNHWLRENCDQILTGHFPELHVPRYLFGAYLLHNLYSWSRRSMGNFSISMLEVEVTDIDTSNRTEPPFEITLVGRECISSDRVVLGIGIPDQRQIKANLDAPLEHRVINNAYKHNLNQTVTNVCAALEERASVAIIGANASAMELLYQLDNNRMFREKDAEVIVLSPSGKLPPLFEEQKSSMYDAMELKRLHDKPSELTADDILEALEVDLKSAEEKGFTISDTLPEFTPLVGAHAGSLSQSEKIRFANYHGVKIGRLQRRSGIEYCSAQHDLAARNRLTIVKGAVEALTEDANDKGVISIQYRTKGVTSPSTVNASFVFNCSGSGGVGSDSSQLLSNMLKKRIAIPSPGDSGILVDDNYQALPGLFVNGPLLAGNVINDMGIWHVEHCGRIIGFAKSIAKEIQRNYELGT